MKIILTLTYVTLILALMTFAGCAASDETSADTSSTTPAVQTPPPAAKEIMDPPAKADTVKANMQNQQKPAFETSNTTVKPTLQMPAGKFSVQVGAYKLLENAEPAASLAKNRFSRNVYTFHDNATDLFKVMVGDFATKEDARLFRDNIVKQYPGDYNDAWVSEITR